LGLLAGRVRCAAWHRRYGYTGAGRNGPSRAVGEPYERILTVDIRQAQGGAFRTAVEHGWWEPCGDVSSAVFTGAAIATIPEKIALIHSEASEALEEYRKNGESENFPYGEIMANGKPVGFASELADIVIRVLDLAGALDINLEGAIAQKMAYNKTRPYRHGGKVV